MRRIFTWFFVVLVFVLVGWCTLAQSQVPLDVGNATCANWIYYRNGEWNKADPGWAPNVRNMGWVAGFLTAFGLGSSAEGKLAHRDDLQRAWRFVDEFCAAHPEEILATAAWTFGKILVDRAVAAQARNHIPDVQSGPRLHDGVMH